MKEKDAEIEQLRKENKELVERLEKVEKLELKERLTTLEEGRAALERRLNSCSAAQVPSVYCSSFTSLLPRGLSLVHFDLFLFYLLLCADNKRKDAGRAEQNNGEAQGCYQVIEKEK